MELLKKFDAQNYKDTTSVFEKYTIRGIIVRDGKIAMQCSKEGEYKIPGGGMEAGETYVEALAREVKEETGLIVSRAEYLFSLPNIYLYSGFPVHTLDMFYRCTVADTRHFRAMDDASDAFFLPLNELSPDDFGLDSIRKGLQKFLASIS